MNDIQLPNPAPLPPPVGVPLTVLPEHACSYLTDRLAQSRAFLIKHLEPSLYHSFMDAGFRRSGKMVYQNICRGCQACIPIRVVVDDFVPDKSQRRVVRKNADLLITIGPAEATQEKFDLYSRYQEQWHRRAADTREDPWSDFVSFLYDSPVQTVEFCYRTATGKLVAVGICDLCAQSLSSVYFYFDPTDSKRSLGTFGGIFEIQWAKRERIPFYYLGYWIEQCPSMKYKNRFLPNEILDSTGRWRTNLAR